MRQVLLRGTQLKASILAFGCANLMGRVGRRQSLRALETAWDAGINYFDTARSYGWGKSEAVLGQFAARRRDRVILATKLGILPPPRKLLLEAARPVARAVLRWAGRLRLRQATTFVRTQVSLRAGAQVATGQFDPAIARASLECSLKALETDYVDVLLLHGCTFDAVGGGEIFELLDSFVTAGTVRYYGLATDLANSERICQRFAGVRVVQLANHLLDNSLAAFSQRDRLATNTHSAFGGGKLVETIRERVGADPTLAQRLAALAGIDFSDTAAVQQLLLRFALAANPQGTVIVGMHSPENIAANVAVADENPALDANLAALVSALRACLAPGKNL